MENMYDSHMRNLKNDPMDNTYHVSGAKALIGAAFIEYLFYGVLYIIEGAKF